MTQPVIPGTSVTMEARSTKTGDEGRPVRDQELKKACADFEAIFIYRMLEAMRKTVPQEGLFSGGGGLADSPYGALMDQKLSETLASRGGGIGIQDVLYEQLKKNESKGGKD